MLGRSRIRELEARLERADAAARMIAHQDGEIVRLRKEVDFYRGKVERLELSIAETSRAPAQQAYAERTDLADQPKRPDITSVEVAKPQTWNEVQTAWGSLTEAEMLERMGSAAEAIKAIKE